MVYVPDAPQVFSLDHHSQNLLDQLWKQLLAKMPRNFERLMYLDGKNKMKDLGVAIPPQLLDKLEVVSGWAEKAVTEPANRTVFDGMLNEEGSDDPLGISGVLWENKFKTEFPQAVKSSMAHSCSFVSVTPGDVLSGDPAQMMMFHSALHATGLWDKRRRSLSAGLLINQVDALGSPTLITLLTPHESIICRKGESWFIEDVIGNRLGRVGLHLLPFDPDLDRPFGRARIDRRVMSIVDRAVRGGARLDVHSELFSAMKLILLGATQEMFTDQQGKTIPLWQWTMSRLNVLGTNEEGETPKLEQVKAESPEPHIATLRQYASEFSGHTGVPLGSLGIAQDNPESADAKNVAREDIVFLVERQHGVYGDALLRSFADIVELRDGTSPSTADLLAIEMLWRRPDRATRASDADAGSKQVASAGIEGTPTGMRMVGMSGFQVKQAMADIQRKDDRSLMEMLVNGQPEVSEASNDQTALEDAQVMKAKADALGVLRRAGVDANSAAEQVGLTGLKFIPGQPITIKAEE